MVKFLFAKEKTRVRFPLSAPTFFILYIFNLDSKSIKFDRVYGDSLGRVFPFSLEPPFLSKNLAETGFEPVTSRL